MDHLRDAFGGIRKMKRLPGMVFIVDPHRERIAVTEARKLEIPIIGTGDTNVDPDELDYIIPANDDAIRAIRLLCSLVADACVEGQRERGARASAEAEAPEAPAEPEIEETAVRRARRGPGGRRRPHVRARRRRGGSPSARRASVPAARRAMPRREETPRSH